MERRHCRDEVVGASRVLPVCDRAEAEIVEPLSDHVVDVRDVAHVPGHPRGRRRREKERDLAEERDEQDPEEEVAEPAARPVEPDERGEEAGDDEVREVHEDREDLERARPVVQVLLQPDRRQMAEEEEPLGVDLGREVHIDADVRQRVRPGRVAEEADEHEPPVAYAPAAPFAPDRDADAPSSGSRRARRRCPRPCLRAGAGPRKRRAGRRPPAGGRPAASFRAARRRRRLRVSRVSNRPRAPGA